MGRDKAYDLIEMWEREVGQGTVSRWQGQSNSSYDDNEMTRNAGYAMRGLTQPRQMECSGGWCTFLDL